MEDKTHIVLFKDGSLSFTYPMPHKSHYQEKARFFVISLESHVYDLTVWIAGGFKETSKIKEIGGNA